jgi:Domain of unknown function (DUF1833)
MSAYSEFFLKSKASIVQLELVEVSHPFFTEVYRKVRNSLQPVTVIFEDGVTKATFDYYPLKITSMGARTDLESGFRIDLGDLGEILPKELDAVAANDAFEVKPTLIYRTYRSDDLSVPLFGPVNLECSNFSFNREGSSFEAKAPALNNNRTGETYLFERFPMLRGFL